MSLKRILRDERGTLYEIPLLLVFVLMGLALVPVWHSWWRGFLVSGLSLIGILIAAGGLGLLLERASDMAALAPVRRVLDSAPARLLWAAAIYLMSGAVCAVMAAFVSIFVAPHLSADAAGQLLAMRALTAAGGLAGFGLVYALRHEEPRF